MWDKLQQKCTWCITRILSGATTWKGFIERIASHDKNLCGFGFYILKCSYLMSQVNWFMSEHGLWPHQNQESTATHITGNRMWCKLIELQKNLVIQDKKSLWISLIYTGAEPGFVQRPKFSSFTFSSTFSLLYFARPLLCFFFPSSLLFMCSLTQNIN